jgi:hypothetical protein
MILHHDNALSRAIPECDNSRDIESGARSQEIHSLLRQDQLFKTILVGHADAPCLDA